MRCPVLPSGKADKNREAVDCPGSLMDDGLRLPRRFEKDRTLPIVREGLAFDLHEQPQLTEPAQRTIIGQFVRAPVWCL